MFDGLLIMRCWPRCWSSGSLIEHNLSIFNFRIAAALKMEYTRTKLEFEGCDTIVPEPKARARSRVCSPWWEAVLRSARNSKLRRTALFLGSGLVLTLVLQA